MRATVAMDLGLPAGTLHAAKAVSPMPVAPTVTIVRPCVPRALAGRIRRAVTRGVTAANAVVVLDSEMLVVSAGLHHAVTIVRSFAHSALKAGAILAVQTAPQIVVNAVSTATSVRRMRRARVTSVAMQVAVSADLRHAVTIARTLGHSGLKAGVISAVHRAVALTVQRASAAAHPAALPVRVAVTSAATVTDQVDGRLTVENARTFAAGVTNAVVTVAARVIFPDRLFPSPNAGPRPEFALTDPLRTARTVRFRSSVHRSRHPSRMIAREQFASTSGLLTWACARAARPMNGWRTAGCV